MPDFVGIDPNAKGLTLENGTRTIPMTPYCPQVARFVADTLDIYVQRNYPVLGIGDSAAILWEATGGRVTTQHGKLACVGEPKFVKSVKDDLDIVQTFRFGDIRGVSSMDSEHFTGILASCFQQAFKTIKEG